MIMLAVLLFAPFFMPGRCSQRGVKAGDDKNTSGMFSGGGYYSSGENPALQRSAPTVESDGTPCVDPVTGATNPLASMSIATTGEGRAVSSGMFGLTRRTISGEARRHTGIDFAAHENTPVYAVADGVIDQSTFVSSARNGYSGRDDGGGYGNTVMVVGQIDGETVGAFYGHLSSITVAPGQTVHKGDIIGYTGRTGNAWNVTNAHLHFEIRKGGDLSSANSAVDPQPYINGTINTNTGLVDDIRCTSSSDFPTYGRESSMYNMPNNN